MALFQGIELRLTSGFNGTSMMVVERLQNASVSFELPRADVRTLNKFRPELNRPIVNWTPVNLTFDYVKSDNVIETALGLTNQTGVICGLVNARALAGYGLRNFEILQAPLESPNYVGQINLISGVLNSYSVSVAVGDIAKTSMSFQLFDVGWAANNNTRTGSNYASTIARGQDTAISGVSFSGFGVSGLSVQSFDLGINISRAEVNNLGNKFPTDRPMVDANATMQVRGFIEAGNTSLTGLGVYDCGTSVNGTFFITVAPSCAGGPSTTYRVINPYFQSFSQSNSVGNFASVDMSFTVPLPISSVETGGGASNLIIS